MAYKIELTDDEYQRLAWMAARGYFPLETYAAMTVKDYTENKAENKALRAAHLSIVEIPEHAAWGILEHRQDDPDSLFACAGPALLAKLRKLESEIV